MIENLAYLAIGFTTTFLALEAAWHFTACKIHDKTIKPCLYKQIGILKQNRKKKGEREKIWQALKEVRIELPGAEEK